MTTDPQPTFAPADQIPIERVEVVRPQDRPRKAASEFVIRRSTRGAVGIRTTPSDPKNSSGKLLGFTMAEDDGWRVTWLDEHGQRHVFHQPTSIAAEAFLFDSLNIAPLEPTS